MNSLAETVNPCTYALRLHDGFELYVSDGKVQGPNGAACELYLSVGLARTRGDLRHGALRSWQTAFLAKDSQSVAA